MSSHIKTILFIITTIVLGALPTFLQYGDYLFFSDYLNQQIPYIMETKRMLSSGCPLWSWNTYLGQNFIGAYSFYTLTSPFVWINCLFPDSWIIKSIFFTLILKYICAYLTSYLYFRKMDITKDNSILGGILYAFSSYSITNLYYYHFFEPLIVFPLLLTALERFFKKERYSMSILVATSFLVTFINYYFSICSFIVAAIYSLCRLLSSDVRVPFKRICLCVSCIILGILLDAAILFPSLAKVMESTRVGGLNTGFDYTWKWVMIERLRNCVMPQIMEGANSIFRHTGYGSTSLCIAVFGMFPAILYCIRNPKNWLTLLFLVLTFMYITPLNSLFSLFTDASYTRWGYALCLIVILLSTKFLDIKEKSNTKYLVIYVTFAISIFALAIHRHGIELPNEDRKILFILYISIFVLNLICLIIWHFSKTNKYLYYFIAICVIPQMCIFHTLLSDKYQDHVKLKHGIKNVREYHSIGNSISSYLKNPNLPKLYGDMQCRSIFYGSMPNSGMINNRACDISFHSVLNFESHKFTQTCDTIWHPLNTTAHNCNQRSYYSLISVGDFIVYNSHLGSMSYEGVKASLLSTNDDYSIYRNEDYIPMGFTYDSYILDSEADTINKQKPKPDVPLLLLSNISISKDDELLFSKYLRHGQPTLELNTDSVISERKKHHSSFFTGTTKGFTSEIVLPKDNFVFYSIPHESGFTAYVDSQEVPIYEVNLGLSAVLVSKGKHIIEFKFIPKGLIQGLYISATALIMFFVLIYIERKNKQRNLLFK